MKLKIISAVLIFALLATSASAANYITPTKENVTEVMLDYNLENQNNSLQLACEIGQYVSEEYGWNCDIRQLNFSNHASVYINVFYPATDNKKGYEAYYGWFGPQKKEVTGFWNKDKVMKYRDWSSEDSWCGIPGVKSYNIVKSYFGNVPEERETTDPANKVPDTPKPDSTAPIEAYNNTFLVNQSGNENSTVETLVVNNSEANNTVENSINTVNNQGFIETVKQYWFDFSNSNWSNVSFNFWSN